MVAATFKEWNGTALVPLTITEVGTRPELRRNLFKDPSFELTSGGLVTSVVNRGGGKHSYDTSWSLSGAGSIKVEGNTSADSAVYLEGNYTAFRMGLVAGKTYTASATARLTAPLTGTLSTAARRITAGIRNADGTTFNYSLANSPQTPNLAGEYPLSVTFTVPLDCTGAGVSLYAGANAGLGAVWWDNFMLVEGTDTGEFFYGSTPNTVNAKYTWAGAVNNSVSIETDARGGAMTAIIV